MPLKNLSILRANNGTGKDTPHPSYSSHQLHQQQRAFIPSSPLVAPSPLKRELGEDFHQEQIQSRSNCNNSPYSNDSFSPKSDCDSYCELSEQEDLDNPPETNVSLVVSSSTKTPPSATTTNNNNNQQQKQQQSPEASSLLCNDEEDNLSMMREQFIYSSPDIPSPHHPPQSENYQNNHGSQEAVEDLLQELSEFLTNVPMQFMQSFQAMRSSHQQSMRQFKEHLQREQERNQRIKRVRSEYLQSMQLIIDQCSHTYLTTIQ